MSTANQKGGGEVHLTSLDLFKNTVTTIADSKKDNRDFIDLLNIYSSFVIYDSILKPFQTGEIIINDSNDLIPNYPILGGNLVHVRYNTPDGPKDTEVDLYFRVVKIKNIIINERKQSFTLQLVSEAGWQNMYTSLSTAFTGSPNDIVNQVYANYLHNKDTNKKMNTEFAAGSLKIVAPRWKPSQVIKWVQDKSLDGDKDNSGFFFYETNRGFNFLSLSTLMNKEKNLIITDVMGEITSDRKDGKTPKGYLFKIPGVPVYGSDGKPQSGMVGSETTQNVDDFRIDNRQRIGEDVIDGYLANKHITHDIFHKSYSTQTFNYFDDFDKYQRLAKEPHYYNSGDTIDSNIKVNFSPRQTKIHSNIKNQPGSRTLYADDYALSRRQSMKQMNDAVIANFEAPGHPIIEAGHLLEFNYPAIRKVEDATDVYEKKYSGLYLIRDVIHMFKPVANTTTTYKVDMNIVKDGHNA